MKNLKKVLAMVLAFACTFTMFASAKVYTDVPAGSQYSEAITMLSDLGIIKGKSETEYKPDDTITRAEACALIARLLTGDPNVENFGNAQNFTDVVKGSWQASAIGYCVANGITVGVGNGKFDPNRPINDQEFLTMMVRALGYETPDVKQNYPFGYMTAAKNIGLVENTQMLAGTDALRGEDAQVIYNALFVDYAKGAKIYNTTHGSTVERYPTLIESVWNLNQAAVGIWEKGDKNDTATLTHCKSHTWVIIGNDPAKKGNILAYPIEDDTTNLYDSKEKNKFRTYSFKYEGATNLDSLKGYKVELWGAGKHGAPTWDKGEDKFVYPESWTIKAIKTVAGQTKYDYDPSMADKKADDGSIELDADTKLGLGSVAGNAKNVLVGDAGELDQFVAKNYNDEKKMDTDKKVEKALNIRDGAKYRLMDWDGDKNIDWIVVDSANYYKVEGVTAKSVTVSWMKPEMKWEESTTTAKETWKRDGSTKFKGDFDIDYKIPEDVKVGDVLEVTYETGIDSKKNIKGNVSVVEAENHKLEKVSTKGGLTLTFDDKEIKVAQDNDKGDVIVPTNPTKYREFNNEELGTEFALHLNRNGFILHSDYVTERANYAMVLDTANGEDRVSNRKYAKVDLLTADNKHMKDVELTPSAVVENVSKGTKDTNAYKDRKFTESKVVGNVYKYWINDDGQITRMRQVIDAENMAQNIKAIEYTYDSRSDALRDSEKKYVASLKDADVVFAVKPNLKGEFTANTTNAGYIQTNGTDFYVDVNDVLAVKQSDIPDIGGTADTNTTQLDNKVNTKTRTETWLGANNDTVNNDYTNKFVAQIDKNGNAEAAILGVDNFNKFGAGSTKIGLVTDITYANSADGKYVEMTASFGGENKTIASAKKVDFDKIVKAYDNKTGKDIDVSSPSTAVDNALFNKRAFDKYLKDSAAYAEITTDADGNLLKVTFLDKSAENELKGHYFTVTRNITLDAGEKSVNYLLNDGTSQGAADGKVYLAKQFYESEGKLYSVPHNLAKNRSAFASDAAFYSIKGKATRADRKYDIQRLTVVDGFARTPDITAGSYSVIEHSSIDSQSNDYYAVADIAFNNSKDVAAVYAFDDTFGEAAATNVANVTVKETTGDKKEIDTVAPGQKITIEAAVAYTDAGTQARLNKINVYDKDRKLIATLTPTSGIGSDKITAEWTVPSQNASTQYTFEAAYDTTEFAGGKTVTVDSANSKFAVSLIQFADVTAAPTYKNNQFKKIGTDSFAVYVGGGVNGNTVNTDAITDLKPENFIVRVDNVKQAINVKKFDNRGNGYYVIALEGVDFDVAESGKSVSVELTGVALADGMKPLTGTATDDAAGQGGKPEGGSTAGNVVTGAGNVGVIVPPSQADLPDGTTEVTELSVNLKTADDKAVVTGLKKENFSVKVDGSEINARNRAVTLTTVEEDRSIKGKYKFTFSEDLRGKSVEISIKENPSVKVRIDVPAKKLAVSLGTPTLTAVVNESFAASNTSELTIENKDNSTPAAQVWLESEKFADGAASKKNGDLTAELSGTTVTVTGTPTTKGDYKFYVGVGDETNQKALLTVTVGEPVPGITISGSGAITVDAPFAAISSKEATITLKGAVEKGDLKIAAGGELTGSETSATDSETGVIATLNVTSDPKIELSGTPTKAGTATFTIGVADGPTATLTVTVGKYTLNTFTITASSSDNTVKVDVGDATVADALAKELNAKESGKQNLVFAGASSADTAIEEGQVTTIEPDSTSIKITLGAGQLTSGQKAVVKITGLPSFVDKEDGSEASIT